VASLFQFIKKLLKQKNVVRAAVIYAGSLLLGVLGIVIFGKEIGQYVLTCAPGFGSGVALAFLNNGHKKPVTYRSVISTVFMNVTVTVIMILLGFDLLAIFSGMGLSFAGSALGFAFCRWENMKAVVVGEQLIDIYDTEMEKIGEMEEREAHDKHQWHKNVHIWVTDGKRVLVQKRAAQKKLFPRKWDASAGGHVDAGDTILQCAKRKWKNELGLPWEFGDPEEADLMKQWETLGEYPRHEFIYFYFFKAAPNIQKSRLLIGEVNGLKWIPFDKFKQLIKTDRFCPYGKEYWTLVTERLGKLMD
jgi:isopentenyldiphosphate isomerase